MLSDQKSEGRNVLKKTSANLRVLLLIEVDIMVTKEDVC